MDWCCIGFKAQYENAGNRGSAVLIGRNYSGGPEFTLQFRAVSQGYEASIVSDGALRSLVTDVGLRFCPWCGVFLADYYGVAVGVLYRSGFRVGE